MCSFVSITMFFREDASFPGIGACGWTAFANYLSRSRYQWQSHFRNIDYATPYMRMDEYVSYLNDNKPLIDDIKASDSGMYRICQNYQLTSNDPMLLGFKGMFHYSSTYTQSVNALTSKLGIGQAWLWNTGYGTTPVTDSLLGVKYLCQTLQSLPDITP